MSLPLRRLAVENYRSLRKLALPVERLTVFAGANGAGKTNLYRALQLVQASALGTLAEDLAAEGGMDSAFWAGERPRGPAQIRLCVGLGLTPGAPDFEYEVVIGFPVRGVSAAFELEPQVKSESLVQRHGRRMVKLLDREGPRVAVRDADGVLGEAGEGLLASETALGRLADPGRYPDLDLVRRTLADWRFHHDLRTDSSSPLRRPCLAVTSPTLSSDGGNLAAVFATLAHIREETTDLDAAVADAFPGAQLDIPHPGRTASFGLVFPDYPQRVFEAHELSDGTLRFLGLAGALLSYRPPAFIALNEPEASLHPDLLEPLARMIVAASDRAQIWIVTHSERLAAALERFGAVKPRRVVKAAGATTIEGLRFGMFDDEEE
ncbi:MAG TPA: AAA family ATPase [Caulobacteraceae bacterium]|nr:AAA family ATPase [Caulobacteraceae bacterium]